MKRLIVSALAAALAVSALAQGTLRQATPESHGMDSEKLAQVDRVINDAIAAKEIPGAVLSVVRGNDIVYLKAYGNFVTLQRILERVTGEKLYEYAQKHVFDVLGLRHTCYFPLIYTPAVSNSAELAGLCAPTEVQADGKPLIAQVHDPMARRIMGGNSGNAGVFSNAEDLSVVCAAVMNGGVLVDKKDRSLESTRILSPLTVRLMATIPPQNDPSVGRALGWDKKSSHSGLRGDLFNPETTIMHTGYTGTSIVIDTETKTAIILLTHRVHPEDKGSVGRLRALVANIVAGSIR